MAFDETRQAWLPVAEAGFEHEQFAIYVWRSVRKTADTKTVKSRRSLKTEQDRVCGAVGRGKELVFCTRTGTALSAGNVRRDFRTVLDQAGLVGKDWTPRECGTASCRCSRPTTSRSRTSLG